VLHKLYSAMALYQLVLRFDRAVVHCLLRNQNFFGNSVEIHATTVQLHAPDPHPFLPDLVLCDFYDGVLQQLLNVLLAETATTLQRSSRSMRSARSAESTRQRICDQPQGTRLVRRRRVQLLAHAEDRELGNCSA
jgi:hypothetical protein